MAGRCIIGSWLLGLVLCAGCARNETVKAYEAWADDACKCADPSCRSAVIARGVKLNQDTQAAEGTLKDQQAVKVVAEQPIFAGGLGRERR